MYLNVSYDWMVWQKGKQMELHEWIHIFIDLANCEIFGCYSFDLYSFKQLHPTLSLTLQIFSKLKKKYLDQWIDTQP